MSGGDLVISFRTEAGAREFEKMADTIIGNAEEIAKTVTALGGTLGTVFGQERILKLGVRVDGASQVVGVTKNLTELEKAERSLTKAIADRARADQGSLTSIRQALNQSKQYRDSLSQTGQAHADAAQKVKQYELALRRASGVEAGSIADIGFDSKDLEQRLRNENLSIDARQRLTAELNKYNVAAQRAQGIEAGSIADLRQQQQQQDRLVQSLRAGSAAQKAAAQNVKLLGDQIAAATPKTFSLIGAFNKIATVQAGITAITIAFGQVTGSVDQVVNRLKRIEAFTLALKNIGLSATETAGYFQAAADSANKLGAPLEQVEKAYTRIVPSLKNIGASSEDTTKFIDNLTARTQVLGLSTEESGRLMEAFAQVLSKGRLQGEELNQQISELDGAFRGQLAAALGVTTEELNKMVEGGEVTSDVFYKAFNTMQNGVELLQGKLASGNATLQQLQNLIKNLNTKTLADIGKVIEPGIRAFLAAGAAFAKLANEIATSALGELLGEIFNQIGYTILNLVNIISVLAKAFLFLISPIAKILQLLSPLLSILLTLKAGYVAAALGAKAFAFATSLLNKQLPATAISAINLKGSLVALGNAMRALYSGQLIQFFTQMKTSIANMILAMNIPIVNSFVNALGRLTKAALAGRALDGVTAAAQGLSSAQGGLGKSLAGNISGLFKFKKAAVGSKLMYGKISLASAVAASKTKAAAGAFNKLPNALTGTNKAAELTTGAIQAMADKALPSLAKSMGRGTAGLTKGAVATGLLKVGLRGLLASTGVGLAVAVGLEGLFQTLEGLGQGGDQAKKPLANLEGTLRELGIQTNTTHGAWLGFIDDLRRIPGVEGLIKFIQQIGDNLKALGLAAGGDRGLSNLASKFKDIEKSAQKAGIGGLTDFANASKLNKKEAVNLVQGLRAQEDAYEETASNIATQIAALKSSGGATEAQIAVLKRQQAEAEAGAEKAKYYASQWEKVTEGQRTAAGAIESTGNALKDVKAAQAAYFNSIDAERLVKANALQDQYNKGLISSGTYASESANLQKQSSDLKLAAIAKEKAALEARAKTQSGTDYAAANRIQELIEQEQAIRTGAAVQTQKLSDDELKAIKERDAATQALGNAYKEAGDLAATAVGNLSSSVGSALESLAETISQQAAIEFSVTGDQAFLQQSLANQAKILDFQYTIGALKIQQQQAEKQFELEMQKLKIQTALIEAQSAAAGGDPFAAKMVQAYQQQLALIPQIQAANQVTSDAALLGLKAETQQKQTQLNLALQAQGLPPVDIVEVDSSGALQNKLDDIYTRAKDAANGIGGAATKGITTGTQKLAEGVAGVNTAVGKTAGAADLAGASFEKAVTNLSEGIKKLSAAELTKGLEEGGTKQGQAFNAEIKKSPALIDSAAKAAKGLGNQFLASINPIQKMQGEVKGVISLVARLSRAVGRMPSGNDNKALGGPVEGGQSYFVNDGGGRESFMNKAGQISLLPAGRNINWRAPRDGFVLPAPMTASLIQNSKINAKIASVSATSEGSSGKAYSSGLANSGNLIQQMGAMMGGATNQRITNNVTIQSQSPVMDASRIMANVARMKARRGLRG